MGPPIDNKTTLLVAQFYLGFMCLVYVFVFFSMANLASVTSIQNCNKKIIVSFFSMKVLILK